MNLHNYDIDSIVIVCDTEEKFKGQLSSMYVIVTFTDVDMIIELTVQ